MAPATLAPAALATVPAPAWPDARTVAFVPSADPVGAAVRTLTGRLRLGADPGRLEHHSDGTVTLSRLDLCLIFCPV
jgi:hypothetical protein